MYKICIAYDVIAKSTLFLAKNGSWRHYDNVIILNQCFQKFVINTNLSDKFSVLMIFSLGVT